ncbi:uncharacterized protein FPRO_14841 [Fusarium proliferatum ET1]|uniref:Related to zinc finger protein odd-paired-like (Opl) n=1 Tax=Fusarium proliferatum (strain ET1) TaxID=1227346 RepID=A0A1L7WAN2_FUSPR|nr:uncharacterized protein FPRO_14841 [Fusarium proliferatum ET1]CZR49681.1 related to zinc finger protein odd-paired-like (opl) [Fusarium proliferatum ET1]
MANMSSLCSHPVPYPSNSSAHEPFTLTPDFGIMDFGITYNSASHQAELNAPLSSIGGPIFRPFKNESEQISFFPDDSMKQGQLDFQYEQMAAMGMTHQGSMGLLAPSNAFDMDYHSLDVSVSAASFITTPNTGVSDPGETSSSWSCASASPISPLSPRDLWQGVDSLEQDLYSQPSLCAHHHNADNFQLMPAQRSSMEHDIQQKGTKLQQAHIRSLKKRAAKSKPLQVDADQRGKSICDYPDCHKTFQRSEHLKRHKNSFHGEAPNRFMCEFCGKDRFNRKDNLDSHRKLHTRRNSRVRGVIFIPDAVPILAEEKRSRRRHAPSNLNTEGKHKIQPDQLHSG